MLIKPCLLFSTIIISVEKSDDITLSEDVLNLFYFFTFSDFGL